MSQIEMPNGRYVSLTRTMDPDAGGMTRATLMRHRLFLTMGAVQHPLIMTIGESRDFHRHRELLHERGLLIDGIELLNIFEYYRDTGWGTDEGTGESAPDLNGYQVLEETHSDGTPWRRTYHPYGAGEVLHDYVRSDGTPFLRVPAFDYSVSQTWPNWIMRIGKDGERLGEFRNLGAWLRRWLREMTYGDDRVFVFADSLATAGHVMPMKDPRFFMIQIVHNIHVAEPRHWNSPMDERNERLLDRIPGMDALVTLTHRQQEDIAERRGRTNNLFVVPNPVEVREAVERTDRDPNLVTVVARLADQKRLKHAVQAFEQVVHAVPPARLEIFGEGPRRTQLQQEIDRRGLGESVILRGHDPHARDTLWRSSAFLMTSKFEGYPLSTLESMSHGCPVVSYDIKYGPREQVTDGVDGFLVPEGDVNALAERVIELLRSPDLVQRMSMQAQEKAQHHGVVDYLEDWRKLLHAIVEQKSHRTQIQDAELTLTRLRVIPRLPLPRPQSRRRDFAAGRVNEGSVLEVAGDLRVRGRSEKSDLGSAELELAAIHTEGHVVRVPMQLGRTQDGFRFKARVKVSDLLPGGVGPSSQAHLRLRLVWRNSIWETAIGRPSDRPRGHEIGYGPDDRLLLQFRGATGSRSGARARR